MKRILTCAYLIFIFLQVIGIMAIETAGGVYCPLSPRDPQQRLHALVKQTQSRLVLVHWLTKAKFQNNFVLVDIDLLLFKNNDKVQSDADIDRLSNVSVTLDHIAYIIFTSGSTGTPKAVSHYINNELV
jgi:non-ribosomal peptide synthetase component F